MDYQVETIRKTTISVSMDPDTFCIWLNNYKMKSMVNVETFMLVQLKHLNACIIQKSHMLLQLAVQNKIFAVTSTKLRTVMFTTTVSQD